MIRNYVFVQKIKKHLLPDDAWFKPFWNIQVESYVFKKTARWAPTGTYINIPLTWARMSKTKENLAALQGPELTSDFKEI